MAMLNIFSKKKPKPEETIEIRVDHRERNSAVPAALESLGVKLKWEQLPVADYIVNGIAVERKSISDLKGSIINKRIISQLLELKQYESHLLIVEGVLDEEMYQGGIHENALRGFLLSVALDYKTPTIFTHNAHDTAKYLYVLAKRKDKSIPAIRASRTAMTKEEQIQFILEGFPNVGPTKAKALVEKFSTLERIFSATEEELKEILGKRAAEFREILDYHKE